MKLKNAGVLKFLRAFHMVAAGIWFGGVVSIAALAYICFFCADEAGFMALAPNIPVLYSLCIMPAAVLTASQGVVYGFFTGWGFIRHKWVLAKWILTLALIPLTGIGGIGQMFLAIEKVERHGFQGGFADGGAALLSIGLQVLILLSMVVISVYKPKNSKNRKN
ncbi:MAG: hypothetical protein LBR98_07225 [Syntrophomonadaceae bacterium]|jgi:hypothetical protein|nr:hypothetical protein [Syntrophomonadaceae bacterium]